MVNIYKDIKSIGMKQNKIKNKTDLKTKIPINLAKVLKLSSNLLK